MTYVKRNKCRCFGEKMEFISMLLFLLQVSGAARRRIQVTGEVGGSITIKCPVKDISSRKFWCRELETGACGTIISTTPYISENYRNRISITEAPQEEIFQITITRLEEEDTGLYMCGTGFVNDKGSGRSLQVELKVSNGNAPPRMGLLSAEPLRRDRPIVVPTESGNKGADTQGVTQPQMTNGARAKYTSYAAPGIKFPENTIITPADVIGTTVTNAASESITKGIPKTSRTIGYAHPRYTKRLLRSNYGNDVFQILIPILLIMLLLVASVIIVRKQLRGKKAASSETYGINQRLSALEHGQGHIPMENIYSVLPRRLEGADRNSSHVPHDSYHCRVDL
ncbi:fas apoptotic inhibitory molecule 3 isoform X3 [Trachemys scripta elegans]|uniref:fas apoptotic inhibitory molecule 3 isoform X3 n=1 Tax=Trachemys scripta elegans TaxID=31138 RepID=UPI0015545012|nr:fas apoptotic inhibitory molecule 3 isoform X3 [Trachemys scripta elegans]